MFMSEIAQILQEIKASVGDLPGKLEEAHRRIDAIETKSFHVPVAGRSGEDLLRTGLKASDDYQKLMRGERRSAIITLPGLALNMKSILSTPGLGSATTGVSAIERLPVISGGGQRRLHMRDVLPVSPCSHGAVDFLKEVSALPVVSPQTETGTKSQAAMDFESEVAPVKTLAVWQAASRQILDDVDGLESFIRRRLFYAILNEEDKQVLAGDGLGQNISGLATEATAFDTGLLGTSWQRLDMIRRAFQMVETADEADGAFVVLHPADWAAIELTKDGEERYIAGDARSMMQPTLWGRPVVSTSAMTQGTFLVCSPSAAEIRLRQDIIVEVSTEHEDYFARNLVAIRAEERLALPVYRPGAVIYGSFTTSPA
jgi:HK97 family phage major capsid protein